MFLARRQEIGDTTNEKSDPHQRDAENIALTFAHDEVVVDGREDENHCHRDEHQQRESNRGDPDFPRPSGRGRLACGGRIYPRRKKPETDRIGERELGCANDTIARKTP